MSRSVWLLSVCVSFVWSKELPSPLAPCEVSPQSSSKCLRDVLQLSISRIARGEVQLGDGSIDPMIVRKLIIYPGDHNPIPVNFTFADAQLTGLNQIRIENISMDLASPEDGWEFNGMVSTPRLELTGPYSVDGKVLILSVKGQGNGNLSLENVRAKFSLIGKPEMRKGGRSVRITDLKLNVTSVSRLWFSLGNLFNGDEILGAKTNEFLNSNWGAIFHDLRPAISTALATTLREYAQTVIGSVPLDDIITISKK